VSPPCPKLHSLVFLTNFETKHISAWK
jgi:hypothetical protein